MKRTLALIFTLLTLAATPQPPAPPVPKVPLHTEFVVEVNAKGQVVRVKSAKGTGDKDPFFNAETYGNVLQMWIRHPDGTAEVGLYRVTYDYNPKNRKIARGISLVSAGGTWGNDPGAATRMIEDAKREAEEDAKREDKSLPPLQSIVGPSSSPTAKP
jgi:hypothetical protein